MMGKLRNIKKVGYQLAHHLSGIVLIIVGKGQFFIMVKQLLSHIPLHLCSHHMALIAHIIHTKTLNDIHDQKAQANGKKGLQDSRRLFCKNSCCQCSQNLRKCQIHQTDNGGAQKIQKKHGFIRSVVTDKFFKRVHNYLLSFHFSHTYYRRYLHEIQSENRLFQVLKRA